MNSAYYGANLFYGAITIIYLGLFVIFVIVHHIYQTIVKKYFKKHK